jgi:hypothetical protein
MAGGPINGSAFYGNEALDKTPQATILVPTMVQIAVDMLSYWENMTCVYNKYWYDRQDMRTWPIAFFYVKKWTETYQRAGEYYSTTTFSLDNTTNYDITVGGGGNAGTTSPTNGGTGGASKFGTLDEVREEDDGLWMIDNIVHHLYRRHRLLLKNSFLSVRSVVLFCSCGCRSYAAYSKVWFNTSRLAAGIFYYLSRCRRRRERLKKVSDSNAFPR